jgi:hypothetical protein
MRDGADRRPGAVPDDEAALHEAAGDGTAADVRGGVDTDGDRHPDTLLTADAADLLVLTDLDGDGLADRVLRIGPDGAVHADAGYGDIGPGPSDATGSAPASTPWTVLLGHLLGPGP